MGYSDFTLVTLRDIRGDSAAELDAEIIRRAEAYFGPLKWAISGYVAKWVGDGVRGPKFTVDRVEVRNGVGRPEIERKLEIKSIEGRDHAHIKTKINELVRDFYGSATDPDAVVITCNDALQLKVSGPVTDEPAPLRKKVAALLRLLGRTPERQIRFRTENLLMRLTAPWPSDKPASAEDAQKALTKG